MRTVKRPLWIGNRRELQMALKRFNRPILIKLNDIITMGTEISDRSLADQYATLCHLRKAVRRAEVQAVKRARRDSRPQ